MTAYLLQLTVGPVQEFIAAARRTRDLWFGSYLLSEISRAVAREVSQHGRLIFPASLDIDNVANVIFCELEEGEPKALVKSAHQAAQERWEKFAEEARREASAALRPDIWGDQVHDVIEFYAAWVPRTEDYCADRTRVMRLLGGRKNCRDFLRAKGRVRVPKSSLDGQRETVLKDGDRSEWPKWLLQKLRLSTGEQLDVVGVTKRLGKRVGESSPSYPSVARVAAEAWLRGMERQGKLQHLKDLCQLLASNGLHTVREERYQFFPYEGTVVYKDRHADLKKELRLADNDLDAVATALKKIGDEPSPYLAVLVADGDRMGAALSGLKCVEEHRALSQALAGFALDAQGIVNRHSGALIYAGGDDVLAFVPTHNCLNCARELHNKFGELLSEWGAKAGTEVTLSVGVAIGHFMENLEDLLGYGRAAEKAAKNPDRDGLAVHLHKRGGVPVKVRKRWPEGLDKRLSDYARWFLGRAVSSRTPYELHRLADLYEDWPHETLKVAIQRDAIRVIEKKRPGGEQAEKMQQLRAAVMDRVKSASDLRGLADELLIARQLAVALRQSGGGEEQ